MRKALLLWLPPVGILVFLSLFLCSCVPQRQIKYLQKLHKDDTTTFYHQKRLIDYKIQPKDNLYIRIFSLDEKTYLYFNKQSNVSSYNDYANDASIYLNSYTVNKDGYIDFPVIGKVYVKDLTVDEVKVMLQKLIDEYLKETTIVVKMVNFKITVVGEVARPGEFTVYDDQINFFEAISQAGDMTEFANRRQVTIIRQTHRGSDIFRVDLTSDAILKSDYYYLQPNDIIYVAPLGIKRWGFGSTFPWGLVFGAISTALLLINYFK
jgi:polysaccharide export outer membrane protein